MEGGSVMYSETSEMYRQREGEHIRGHQFHLFYRLVFNPVSFPVSYLLYPFSVKVSGSKKGKQLAVFKEGKIDLNPGVCGCVPEA